MLIDSCDEYIILRTSSDVFIFKLGLRFEGLLWERYILKGQIAFEGHWRLQSLALPPDWIKKYWLRGAKGCGALCGCSCQLRTYIWVHMTKLVVKSKHQKQHIRQWNCVCLCAQSIQIIQSSTIITIGEVFCDHLEEEEEENKNKKSTSYRS